MMRTPGESVSEFSREAQPSAQPKRDGTHAIRGGGSSGRSMRDGIEELSKRMASIVGAAKIGCDSIRGGTAGASVDAPIGPSPRHCRALTPDTHFTFGVGAAHSSGELFLHFAHRGFTSATGSRAGRDFAQQQLAVSRPHGVRQPHACTVNRV